MQLDGAVRVNRGVIADKGIGRGFDQPHGDRSGTGQPARRAGNTDDGSGQILLIIGRDLNIAFRIGGAVEAGLDIFPKHIGAQRNTNRGAVGSGERARKVGDG